MNAYLAIKYHPDCSNRALIEQLTIALETCHINTFCVARDIEKWGKFQFAPQELMVKSFAWLQSSDLMIMECSEKGVGLGIEAGYAYANNIPIIGIARTGSDISTTLQGISQDVIFYDRPADLIPEFIKRFPSIS